MEQRMKSEKFRNKLWLRVWGGFAIAAVGLAVLVISFACIGTYIDNAFVNGFYTGGGGGFIGAGLAIAIQSIRTLRNPTALRAAEIAEYDERSRMVELYTARAASLILLLGVYAATIVASFFSEAVFLTLLSVLGVGLIVWFGTYLCVRHKM